MTTPTTRLAAAGAGAASAGGTGQAMVAANLAAKQPLIDEAARVGATDARGRPITAAVSRADTSPGHKWDSAWTDGTFKSPTDRLTGMTGDLTTQQAAGRGAVADRLAAQGRNATAPVGGTVAVADQSTGVTGNSRFPMVRPVGQQQADARAGATGIVDQYATPGTARTTFDGAAPRTPFIAGANGDVTNDYTAGGRYSSVNGDGSARPAAAVAAAVQPAPRQRIQQAEDPARRARFYTAR